MKKKYIVVISILLLILGSIAVVKFMDSSASNTKPLDYYKAIDKIYSCDISGMSITIMTSNKLLGGETKIYNAVAGNKDDRFSAYTNDGVKLWAGKQLFLRLKDLEVQKEANSDMFQTNESEYYTIHAVQDYVNGKKTTNINDLIMFVNTKNYNIYLPKDYITPSELSKSSVTLREYKADNIAKVLIDTLVKLQN